MKGQEDRYGTCPGIDPVDDPEVQLALYEQILAQRTVRS